MAKIYEDSGVYPIAALMEDGVRHAYYYMERRRPTLYEALQPFRLLSNEILLAPSEYYGRLVIDRLESMGYFEGRKTERKDMALALCLAIPISSSFPEKVAELLNIVINATKKDSSVNRIVNESLSILRAGKFPKI